jgi:hypothetical protein
MFMSLDWNVLPVIIVAPLPCDLVFYSLMRTPTMDVSQIPKSPTAVTYPNWLWSRRENGLSIVDVIVPFLLVPATGVVGWLFSTRGAFILMAAIVSFFAASALVTAWRTKDWSRSGANAITGLLATIIILLLYIAYAHENEQVASRVQEAIKAKDAELAATASERDTLMEKLARLTNDAEPIRHVKEELFTKIREAPVQSGYTKDLGGAWVLSADVLVEQVAPVKLVDFYGGLEQPDWKEFQIAVESLRAIALNLTSEDLRRK